MRIQRKILARLLTTLVWVAASVVPARADAIHGTRVVDSISDDEDLARYHMRLKSQRFSMKATRPMPEMPGCSRNFLAQFTNTTLGWVQRLKSNTQILIRSTSSVKGCKSSLANVLSRIKQTDYYVSRKDFAKARKRLLVIQLSFVQCSKSLKKVKASLIRLNTTSWVLSSTISWVQKCSTCLKKIPPPSPPPSPPPPSLPSAILFGQIPYYNFVIESSPKDVLLDGNNFLMSYNRSDVVVRSASTFKWGVFTFDFRCPPTFGGLGISLYLSNSYSGGPIRSDALTFEFIGDSNTQLRANAYRNGTRAGIPTTKLPYNCSDAFHKYTIAWSPNLYMFLVDGEVVRTLDQNQDRDKQFFPISPDMYFVANIRLPSIYLSGFGVYDPSQLPVFAYVRNFLFTPLYNTVLVPPPLPSKPFPLKFLTITYGREAVNINYPEITVTYSKSLPGANFRSPRRMQYGRFSSLIKCSAGNTSGLVTSFYTSSFEGYPRRMDEIDFEFLGHKKNMVQTCFWVNGTSTPAVDIYLGFDTSEDFHNYTILWTPEKIEWYVDNNIVRTVWKEDRLALGLGYPTKPSYVYASLWNANNRYWTGSYNGSDAPYNVEYKNIEIYSPPV